MKKIILSFLLFLITYCSICFFYFPTVYGISDNHFTYQSNMNCLVSQKPDDAKLNIYSKRALIYERKSRIVLYEKNMNEICPMASTTKIMTAIVVIENSNLNDIVTVSKKAAKTSGSRLGLKTGDKIKLLDLLYGLLLPSGNDAAYALAEHTRWFF